MITLATLFEDQPFSLVCFIVDICFALIICFLLIYIFVEFRRGEKNRKTLMKEIELEQDEKQKK